MTNSIELQGAAGAVMGGKPIRFADLLVILVGGIAMTFVVGIWGGMAGAVAVALHLVDAGNFAALLQGNFYFIVGVTVLSDAGVLLVIWWRAKRLSPRPMARFFPKIGGGPLLAAALSALVLGGLSFAAEALVTQYTGASIKASAMEAAMMPNNWTEWLIVIAAFTMFVPFYEEFLFRGFVLGWLRQVTPVWIAILISAGVFAAVHGLFFLRGGVSGWVGTGEIFAVGVLMAWWAVRSGSLWPALMVHFVNNALAFSLYFFVPALR
jgi:membrane protease YdiL (CAAX protease family)